MDKGLGKAGIDQVYLDRIRYRIITNPDAALVTLKSGGVDYIERLTPVQAVRGTGSERFAREFRKLDYFVPGYTFIAWKLMNKPTNVDFLIATDSEMKKVNWTTRAELIGSTKVVIFFMMIIAAVLFLIDVLFGYVFYWFGVLWNKPF